jgi:hypothetical protein
MHGETHIKIKRNCILWQSPLMFRSHLGLFNYVASNAENKMEDTTKEETSDEQFAYL